MESSICRDFAVFVGVLVVLAPLAFGQDASLPRAETILDKLEAKIGDASTRKAVKTLAVKGTLSMKDTWAKGTFEEDFLDAEHLKFTINFPGMGAMTMGRVGATTWTTDAAMGASVKDGNDGAAAQRMFAVAQRAPWRSMYESAETVGKTDVEGRPHFEIRMKARDGKVESWFVDCETYVLSRFDLSLPDPMGGAIPMQFLYSDWKSVGGVLYPFTRKQKVMSMEIGFLVESVTPNAPVTSEQVAPPADVVAAIKDPKKRTPMAPEKGGDVTIDTVKAQPIASIRMTIDAKDVSKTLAIILPEVGTYVSSVGGAMAGPPFSRYHKIEGDKIDIEAGMPLKSPVASKGRVLASELPAGKVAMTWHIGPYTTLTQTYDKLKAWMKDHSMESAGGFWEFYWTDPGLEPDPAKWRTQIFWPLK
ncbi:MAG: GyrI-like domain-containing protein [Planctomycetes bacterium]|nr:GyrI-like domain-containing protein [Planctomycetota bacterium]